MRVAGYEGLEPSCLTINDLIPVRVNKLARYAVVGGGKACCHHSFNCLVLEKHPGRQGEDVKN